MPEQLRLMILGGGSSQRTAFRAARARGYHTILADRNPDAPLRGEADAFAHASTFDHAAIAVAARHHRADALLVVGTDQPVLAAAYASREAGLPYPLSVEQARAITNKVPMKETFRRHGIPCVPSVVVGESGAERLTDAEWRTVRTLHAPWVIKPVDSQGQRGIACVYTRSALEEHLALARSFSRERHVLVEEYYPSTEVTVSGWAGVPESVEIWAVTDRVTITNPPSLGICIAHRFPCAHPRYLPEIRDLTERIVSAFKLSEGPIYFQMLVGDRGVLVNEVAFRLGGAYEDISLPLVTGIDVLGRQLDAIETAVQRNRGTRRDEGEPAAHHRGPAAGEPAVHHRGPAAGEPAVHHRGPAAGEPAVHHRGPGPAAAPAQCFAVPLIFAHPGVIHRYRGDDIVRSQPGVYDCRFLLPLGTEIRPMQNATQRIAYAVVAARTREAVRTLIDFVFDTLRAEDEAGNNLIRDTRDQTYLTDDA